MNTDWLDDLERLEKAASRDWITDLSTKEGDIFTWIMQLEGGLIHPVAGTSGRVRLADAHLITALRNAAPQLLAIAKAARMAESQLPCTCDSEWADGEAQCVGCALRAALEPRP